MLRQPARSSRACSMRSSHAQAHLPSACQPRHANSSGLPARRSHHGQAQVPEAPLRKARRSPRRSRAREGVEPRSRSSAARAARACTRGVSTFKDFVKTFLSGEDVRSVERNVRVAQYASPDPLPKTSVAALARLRASHRGSPRAWDQLPGASSRARRAVGPCGVEPPSTRPVVYSDSRLPRTNPGPRSSGTDSIALAKSHPGTDGAGGGS